MCNKCIPMRDRFHPIRGNDKNTEGLKTLVLLDELYRVLVNGREQKMRSWG